MIPPELVPLEYRLPYDWLRVLRFLGARSMKGVEAVDDDAYLRTVRLGEHAGWIRVRNEPAGNRRLVELTPSLASVHSALSQRLARLFDTVADPEIIAAHLSPHALLAASLTQRPGLRVLGAFDAFELVVRAILGRLVLQAGAHHLFLNGCLARDGGLRVHIRRGPLSGRYGANTGVDAFP